MSSKIVHRAQKFFLFGRKKPPFPRPGLTFSILLHTIDKKLQNCVDSRIRVGVLSSSLAQALRRDVADTPEGVVKPWA
jgi:hypothetical protein